MFGRYGTKKDADAAAAEREELPRGASALIGGSGVSLDGQSLILPDAGGGDDVSSINTSNYEYTGGMRILGTMEHDEEIPANHPPVREVMNKSSQARANGQYEHKTYEYHHSKGRNEGKDAKSAGSEESEDGGCLPLWITDAPTWLKLVIVLSTALLVGAIVLIGVGAALAVQDDPKPDSGNSGFTNSGNDGNFGAPTLPPVIVITTPPVTVNMPTPSDSTGSPPTPSGSDGQPPMEPTPSGPTPPTTTPPPTTKAPTPSPTVAPVASPTGSNTPAPVPPPTTAAPVRTPVTPAPTRSPTRSPTSHPTSAPTDTTKVSFFVTGGRFTGDSLAALPSQLASLPNIDGNTVLFHLGDWNSPFATSCVESSYTDNVQLYMHSSVPVYFVPGDNEFNDCPNPTQAFGFWYEYILDFETKFWPAPTAWNISRQEPDYSENFAFIQNGLLIISINLVGGVVHDSKEWEDRHAANNEWIEDQYYRFLGDFSVMVVLAHADPDIQANEGFFTTFYQRVRNIYKTQVIFIHRNLGVDSWALEPNFNGISNLMVVVVEGSVWPPMLVEIDTAAGIVDIDQQQWYNNFLATGRVSK